MIPFDDQKSHDFKIGCDILDANSNPQSSFSVRNYVFNSRSKNIGLNWPFSHKSLQICLQHEVKNILPPFQSLESIRNNSSVKEIISSSCYGKSNLELTFESRKSKKHQTDLEKELSQTMSKKPVLGFSKKTELETAMASKLCPVCKIFSSSSNTTLNAHIDQCLSGESTMKWAANCEIVNKHRIKPRKMKLMVDIYKNAAHCTVKELDARNGTSWANDSSFPDKEIEFQGEREKDEHEDPVYIDTNRKKLRTLSVPKAYNDALNDGSQKKEQKSGKVYLRKKKNTNHERKHDQKYLKQSLNRKKSSFEVTVGPEENINNGECCNKEAMNTDDLQIIRPPWACSKRTIFAEKNLADKCFLKTGFKPASSSFENSQKTGSLSPNKVHTAKKRSPMSTKPSTKHLKQESMVKQTTNGKIYCEIVNLLEVKKNEKMESCKPEYDLNFSKSLNEDPSCGIESVRKQTQLNKEQLSTMQVTRRSDNMFDSRERVTDVTNDMSDSPNSTVSNPSLAAPRNNEKYALNTLSSGDLKSKAQSQTIGFKNDHDQPCCCSRKEIASTYHDQPSFNFPPPLPPPPTKFLPYYRGDSAVSSSKPVIRLMGKNLTVVNTNEDNNVQIGFKSQHSTLLPAYSLNNHALDTMLKDYSFLYGATDTSSLFHKLL